MISTLRMLSRLGGLTIPACLLAHAVASAQSHGQVLVDNEFGRAVTSLRVTGAPVASSSAQGAVVVFLTAGLITPQGAEVHDTVRRIGVGDILWIPPGGLTSRVVSADPIGQVRIALRMPPIGTPWTTPLDPLTTDSGQYSLVLENDPVRVMRVKVRPSEVVGPHEHALRRAVVYLTDMRARIVAADGAVNVIARKAGEASWNPPAKHTEENLEDAPMDLWSCPVSVDT